MSISSRPASGMRDFLADDVKQRQWVIRKIVDAYRQFGFVPLETPAIERLNVLTGKYGDEGDQLMFKLLVRGEKLHDIDPDDPATMTDLALHYDLTVPLARVFAEHRNELPKFYKRYQIQPVWRADRPQKGRFREFYQCDVDYVGTTSTIAELEVLGAMLAAMDNLQFERLRVRINDRRILEAIMQLSNITADSHETTLTAIDKLDKIGGEKVCNILRDHVGLNTEQIDSLTAYIPALAGDDVQLGFDEFVQVLTDNGATSADFEDMKQLLDDVESLATENQTILFDPTLVRGMSYYTGPIFEFDSADFDGSIAGGGRYDGLVGMFSGQDVPAVGGSLGLERILVIMKEREMFPDFDTSLDVLFVQLDDACRNDVVDTANKLRETGFSVGVYPDNTKLGKQFKYAESIGTRFVALLGKRERKAGTIEVKDLLSGEQQSIPAEKIAEYIGELPLE